MVMQRRAPVAWLGDVAHSCSPRQCSVTWRRPRSRSMRDTSTSRQSTDATPSSWPLAPKGTRDASAVSFEAVGDAIPNLGEEKKKDGREEGKNKELATTRPARADKGASLPLPPAARAPLRRAPASWSLKGRLREKAEGNVSHVQE